ncbi:MAG TPA: hypothetical protein VIO64_03020 [Pseudobacteroides sp.]|uniref:hypothetical protein n=1 Tax=Pseudobacteroides sp. TaxID=1968840 RepID=UPI002F940282
MFKTYDFSVDLSNIDRNAYINEAARLTDDLTPHQGETVRAFTQDKASFGETPEVYKITVKDFIEKKRNIPHIFSQLSEDYDFYWIRFPVNFIKKSVWAFNKLEVIIDLLADPENPQRYPKAFQVLPDKKFLYPLQSSSSIAVNIDDNFQFSADPRVETHDLFTLAQVSAKSESNTGMVLGPLKYSLKRARVDHSDIGNQWIFWMLDGIEFVQDSSPDLVIITQIAKNTEKLNIRAQLQAYCDFSLLHEDIQTVVGSLPDDIKRFFIKGCPASDIKEYRLTL